MRPSKRLPRQGNPILWAWLPVFIVSNLALTPSPPNDIRVQHAEAEIQFPDQIQFHIQAEAKVEIVRVELEYGVDMAACAAEINLATPQDFLPGPSISATYSWLMRRTGSLPPGAQIWWRWHLVDAQGHEVRTETARLTWIDDVHPWKAVQSESVYLHWYAPDDPEFAQTLLDAAAAASDRLAVDLGIQPARDIHLYIYDSTDALREAILFEAGWTGGMAFPVHGIVILGIAPSDIDWGVGAIAHELAHVFIGSLVSHCYSYLPSWLNEGLAVRAEGGLDPASQQQLEDAIQDNALLSVRTLNDAFTEYEGRAYLSYAQSYSLVAYLMDTYGQEKMKRLLDAFQAGYRTDHALAQVYGVDLEGLEAEWRVSIGARPLVSSPDLVSTATIIPTMIPIFQPPAPATATPIPTPPSGWRLIPGTSSGGTPGYLAANLFLCCLCLSALVGAIAIGVRAALGGRSRGASPRG